MQPDYYKILAVDRGADELTLKCAYYKLAVQYHPDRNQGSEEAEQKFKEVAEAYGVLSDPVQRSAYDARSGPAPTSLSQWIAPPLPTGRPWHLHPFWMIPCGVSLLTAFLMLASVSGLGRFFADSTSHGQDFGLRSVNKAEPQPADNPSPSPHPPARRAPKSIGTVTVARGARPITRTELAYPPEALREHVSGLVELQLTIAEDGSVLNPHVLSGDPALAQGITEAIGHWRFQSMRVNGKPVPLTTEMTLRFDITR